jgi:glycosyltransferase involved in cell wall biosynthesis
MVKCVIYLGGNDPRIHKRGVEVVIIDQAASCEDKNKYYIFFGERHEMFTWDNLISISIRNDIWKYIVLNIWLLRLYIKFDRSVIIHSHDFIKVCAFILKTDILTVHDAIYYQRKSNKQWNFFLFYFVEIFAYFKTKRIHFISKFAYSKSLLSQKRFNKDGIIIYDTTPVESYMKNIGEIKNSPCDKHCFNLFTVRGIQERTRIDLLMDFAEYVKVKSVCERKIHIFIAGKGKLLEYYSSEKEKRNLDNLTFLGYITDEEMCRYYKFCDMVILPSEYAEGFGLPLIEAYYFNKPVIASDRCAIPEIIISDDFLFDNTPESIWLTLCRCLHISCDYKGFYDINYSNNKILKEYRKLYEKKSF